MPPVHHNNGKFIATINSSNKEVKGKNHLISHKFICRK